MKDIMSKKFEINNKNKNKKQIELITLVKNRSAAASLPPSAGTEFIHTKKLWIKRESKA